MERSQTAAASAVALYPSHRKMAWIFGLLLPILACHLLQPLILLLDEYYYENAFTELGERLLPALSDLLTVLLNFLIKLAVFGMIGLYVMRRLRLPGDKTTRRWLRWLPAVLLLPYVASYWIAFVFGDPTWNSLGLLTLNILLSWGLDLLLFGCCFWQTKRYARRYRAQTELSPGKAILPRKNAPLQRLFFRITLFALLWQGAFQIWNTTLLILAYGGPDSFSEIWTLASPYLLLLAQLAAGYLLCLFVARTTQAIAPAEKDTFSKG